MYDCWKPTLARVCIIGGRVNASASQMIVRVLPADVGDQPLPELHRLGVRVVDPEDRDAVVDPDLHDAADLGVDALRVVVEVERIDVLVLLRRVLGVGDRAVRPGGEPLRVLGDPRMVRRAVQRQVEGDLQAELGGPRPTNASKSSKVPRSGWIGVVAAVGRADRVRASRGRAPRRAGCCCGPCG